MSEKSEGGRKSSQEMSGLRIMVSESNQLEVKSCHCQLDCGGNGARGLVEWMCLHDPLRPLLLRLGHLANY